MGHAKDKEREIKGMGHQGNEEQPGCLAGGALKK